MGNRYVWEKYSLVDAPIMHSKYKYFMVDDTPENRRRYYYNLNYISDIMTWDVVTLGGSSGYSNIDLSNINGKYDINIVEAVEGTTKGPGTLQGNVASTSSTTYPANGLSGTSWYIYKGADNIDPSGVSYSNNKPKGGESLGVTVTPRSNTFGGTIYYQYSYSTDGGATWYDSGSKTTSTTKYITVPKGKAQFRARVIASNSLGYTSATYVMGTNLPVVNMRMYIGIGGRARKIANLYVGINGRARKVVKGYIGDSNGKARSWF